MTNHLAQQDQQQHDQQPSPPLLQQSRAEGGTTSVFPANNKNPLVIRIRLGLGKSSNNSSNVMSTAASDGTKPASPSIPICNTRKRKSPPSVSSPNPPSSRSPFMPLASPPQTSVPSSSFSFISYDPNTVLNMR